MSCGTARIAADLIAGKLLKFKLKIWEYVEVELQRKQISQWSIIFQTF